MGFAAIDYLVLLAYLVGVTIFGTLFRRSQHTARDYFLGSRRTSWIVICLSIVATETSTLTLIGVPAIAYAAYPHPEQGGSLTYLQIVVGYIIARFVISIVLIPAYFQGDLVTAYALLERRFGVRARHVAASLFMVMRALAEGVRIFATSLVIAAVLGTSLPGLPHLWAWSILVVGVLTLIYTFEGGFTAVVWTDLVQFLIYMGGSLLAAWKIYEAVPGGWETIVTTAGEAGKLQALSFSWDLSLPFTFWAGIIGGTFLTMASHGTDQLLVQRLLACGSRRDSQKALILSGFIVFAQFALFLFVGIMLFAYYRFHPVPPITTTDEIFPAFIVRNLPSGLSGLVIAAIFAAAMSTLSSALNSLSSTTMVDFYRPLFGQHLEEARVLRLSRWFTAAWGIVLMAVAVLARNWGSVFTAGLSIASIVYGPMLGAFLLGVLPRRANQRGVITGMTVSLAAMIAVWLFTPLAWTWYVVTGTALTVATGLVASELAKSSSGRGAATSPAK